MGATFENLTWDDLCDLMCGKPEDDSEDEQWVEDKARQEAAVIHQ